MKNYAVAITDLVSLLYRSGDLTSDTFQNVKMPEGTKAHQIHQSQYLERDQKEVFLSGLWTHGDSNVVVSGRLDGLLFRNNAWVIEEIKSTRKNIYDPFFEPKKEHEAQLKLYAYLYMVVHNKEDIKGRLTYVQIHDGTTRSFDEDFDLVVLKPFFEASIEGYLKWMAFIENHRQSFHATLKTLVFPFDQYRRGQREMMSAVYQNMMESGVLYTIAPTGIGKTMAALFSTLKSIHRDQEKVFYLTAKTQGKQVALDCMNMLVEAGLAAKTIEITSKDTLCFLPKRECDPEKCLYAKGFFDRLNEATFDLLNHETFISRDVLISYALKHQICPFEFSLDIALFADVIILDYNYVFDPKVRLIRFFDDTPFQPKLLVDEAHNMVSRSRDMYSASLHYADFIELRKAANKLKPSIRHGIKKVLDAFDALLVPFQPPFQEISTLDDTFIEKIEFLMKKIEHALRENPTYSRKSDIMEMYLDMLAFMKIKQFYGPTYVTNLEQTDDSVKLVLQCLDASQFILDTLKEKTKGSVFFSATLYPIEYYMTLISQGYGETLKIRSPFPKDNLKLIMFDAISTRFTDRAKSIEDVVAIIVSVVEAKKGNYIAFFPSYQYLNQVFNALPDALDVDLIIQESNMDLKVRHDIMSQFKKQTNKSQLAGFVMGGMFSEGIDYLGDMLHGVIVVGVGLPMIHPANDQLKAYYQEKFNHGFDYAYTYPGMNKVIQAVGRVIRSAQDRGVAVLIDDRFLEKRYRALYPKEWHKVDVMKDPKHLKARLLDFWK